MVAGGVHPSHRDEPARPGGAAPNNFPATLVGRESDLAREIVQDPYDLDFWRWTLDTPSGRWEDALVAADDALVTELGDGFAFVGR